MKLAEALMERADLQRRMEQLGSRLRNNARVQEGEDPAEDPKELLKELTQVSAQLEEITTRINLTNSRALPAGETLTALLARREVGQKKLEQLRSFLECASRLIERGTRTEIKVVSTVNVRELQKELDRESKSLRELDATIQAANWTTELQ